MTQLYSVSRRKLVTAALAYAALTNRAIAWLHGSTFVAPPIIPPPVMTHFDRNIVTDYGAPTDGITDTTPSWKLFQNFLASLPAGSSVTLTVPNHTYLFDTSPVPAPGISLVIGVIGGLTVIVDAPSGATLTWGTNPNSSGYALGTPAIRDLPVDVGSSRIASANIGDTSVALLKPADSALYTVGQWIAVAGIDLQGFGSPPNPAFFEYRQITAINSGVIRFSDPLENKYLSTWPNYQDGVFVGTDLGGPATIFRLDRTWDVDATYNNIVFDCFTQVYTKARSMTLNNCRWTSGFGLVPSQSISATLNNCDLTNQNCEIDKMVETLTYNNCTATDTGHGQLLFQSMSGGKHCFINNCNLPLNVGGTPQNMTITDSTIGDFGVAPAAYGRTDSVTVTGTNLLRTFSSAGPGTDNLIASGFTMANGVISIPFNLGPMPWGIPGTKLFFAATTQNDDSYCTVTDISYDATNLFITTDATGGFPPIPQPGGTDYRIRVHPCPVWNSSGNSGALSALGLDGAPAQNTFLYNYSKRTYTKNDLVQNPPVSTNQLQFGTLVAININVTTPYTGVQPALAAQFLQFVLSADHKTYLQFYRPIINLKQAGLRSITPTAIVTQPGDSGFSIPGAVWIGGAQNIFEEFPWPDVSHENAGPVVTIEMITDQGGSGPPPPPLTGTRFGYIFQFGSELQARTDPVVGPYFNSTNEGMLLDLWVYDLAVTGQTLPGYWLLINSLTNVFSLSNNQFLKLLFVYDENGTPSLAKNNLSSSIGDNFSIVAGQFALPWINDWSQRKLS